LANGTYTPGTFVVSIDDGSGATPSGTVTTVATAVNLVRPIGTTAVVQAASKLSANVTMTLTMQSGYSVSSAQAAVSLAITTYINSLSVAATLPYSILSKIAYDAYTGIANITGITLNSGTSDLTPTAAQVIRAGTITVNA
ncbi:MAG: hypothetical protein B7Z81_06340, partial [Acidocella sp. 20-61-6]